LKITTLDDLFCFCWKQVYQPSTGLRGVSLHALDTIPIF
jgi:hypothetical protein